MMERYTIEEWFSRPWKERHILWFWYKIPLFLDWDGRDEFDILMRESYPIQYWFRKTAYWAIRHRWNRIYEFFDERYRWLFKPQHCSIRAAVPRLWNDLDSVMIDVNFAIILSFKKEADNSCVAWDSDEEHREFMRWLTGACYWIQAERPALEKAVEELGENLPMNKGFMKLRNDPQWIAFSELNQATDKKIEIGDTKVLQGMIENRRFFWT